MDGVHAQKSAGNVLASVFWDPQAAILNDFLHKRKIITVNFQL